MLRFGSEISQPIPQRKGKKETLDALPWPEGKIKPWRQYPGLREKGNPGANTRALGKKETLATIPWPQGKMKSWRQYPGLREKGNPGDNTLASGKNEILTIIPGPQGNRKPWICYLGLWDFMVTLLSRVETMYWMVSNSGSDL